jgi:hypothetical protein
MKTTPDFSSSPMEFYRQISLCEIGFALVQLFYYFLANMVDFYGFWAVVARNGVFLNRIDRKGGFGIVVFR